MTKRNITRTITGEGQIGEMARILEGWGYKVSGHGPNLVVENKQYLYENKRCQYFITLFLIEEVVYSEKYRCISVSLKDDDWFSFYENGFVRSSYGF